MRRSYVSYVNDKSSFLDNYLPISKTLNGNYKILKVIFDNEPKQFLVEDQSDYLKYLGVKYPTWKFTIISNDKKVEQVIIDTTETYQKYQEDIKMKDEEFERWLDKKHSGETREKLYNTEGLLIQRLKEYSKEIK